MAKNESNSDLNNNYQNNDFRFNNQKNNKKQKHKDESAIHRPISILNSNPMLPPIK